MKQGKIQVIIVEPMRIPRMATIKNTLTELQQIVGGYIEVVSPFNDTAVLVCNEEGKMIGLPLNRHIGNDIIAGAFVIIGSDDSTGEFISLTDSQIHDYQELFSFIEIFISTVKVPARSSLTEQNGGSK